MKIFSSRGLFALAFALLVVSNIAVLSSVAYNRSGSPEALTILTERELKLQNRFYRVNRENSGLSLQLTWRVLGPEGSGTSPAWRSPAWLGAEKLKELGFSVNESKNVKDWRDSYRQAIAKELYIVLENDGEAYRESVKRAEEALAKAKAAYEADSGARNKRSMERAEQTLKRERLDESRLFAVDAGLDPRQLRKKYSDRFRFIITRGLVRPRPSYPGKNRTVVGIITRLSTENIHVPLEDRRLFDAVPLQRNWKPGMHSSLHYKVALAYGKGYAPWLVSVRPAENESEKE